MSPGQERGLRVWKCAQQVSLFWLFQALWDLLPTIFNIGKDLKHRKKRAETSGTEPLCLPPSAHSWEWWASEDTESNSRPRGSISEPTLTPSPSQRPPTQQHRRPLSPARHRGALSSTLALLPSDGQAFTLSMNQLFQQVTALPSSPLLPCLGWILEHRSTTQWNEPTRFSSAP